MSFYFNELKSYIGFTEEDATQLRVIRPHIEPYFSTVVEKFYFALENNPRTSSLFSGPEQLERLRKSLFRWLEEIFTGPFDENYFEKRQRIGKVHVQVGLLPHFMFGAMNIIRLELSRQFVLYQAPSEAHIALQKILDLELAVMVQSYCDKVLELKMEIPAALAAGMAHEIRNPLNAIGLHMTLLDRRLHQSDNAIAAGVESSIEGVRGEIRRLRGLTSEIIDFAKPMTLRPEWCDGQDLLHGIETLYKPILSAANITFNLHQEGSVMIYCDRERLKQALINLLTNSVEALDGQGRIKLQLLNSDEDTTIIFEDDGPGLQNYVKFKAFDLFYTTKASGTGMGLPIVRKIISAHDGTIDIELPHKGGVRFHIKLPKPRPTESTP